MGFQAIYLVNERGSPELEWIEGLATKSPFSGRGRYEKKGCCGQSTEHKTLRIGGRRQAAGFLGRLHHVEQRAGQTFSAKRLGNRAYGLCVSTPERPRLPFLAACVQSTCILQGSGEVGK